VFQQTSSPKAHDVFRNEQIRADVVIVLDEQWNNLWEYGRNEALSMAQDQWLDLVQVRFQRDWDRKIVTAKIIDYGKYLFDMKKKEKKRVASQPKWVKEIKLWYTTSFNDIEVKMKKARELLQEGYTLKLVMKLKWREWNYQSQAVEKMHKAVECIADIAKSQFPQPRVEKFGIYTSVVLQ